MSHDWKPSDLTGLKLWWDGTDPGAVIRNKDGTVAAIIDKSTRRGRARCWIRRHVAKLRKAMT